MQLPILVELTKSKFLAKHIIHYNKKSNKHSLTGNIKTKAKGQGLDFYQVRKYVFGDETKNIDWHVSARTNQIHVKEFYEEKETKIDVLCDVSPNMQFATIGKFKYLIAAEIVSLLCYAAELNKELMQTIFFGQNLQNPVTFKQRNQKSLTLQILNFLCTKQKQHIVNSNNDLLNSVSLLNKKTKTKGICFIIITQIELEQNLMSKLQQLSNKKEIYIINIYDIFDIKLPNKGTFTFTDASTKEITINLNQKKAVENYNKDAAKRHDNLVAFCNKAKIKLIDIATDDDILIKLLEGIG